MVYLDSVRRSRRELFRQVGPGSRTPLELTALGRAWLFGTTDTQRIAALAQIEERLGPRWPAMAEELAQARVQLAEQGYCSAAWQIGILSIAAPVRPAGMKVHALNLSFAVPQGKGLQLERQHAPVLLALTERVRAAIDAVHTDSVASR
jgi:DNA-binding IclR family transcriptional regulator